MDWKNFSDVGVLDAAAFTLRKVRPAKHAHYRWYHARDTPGLEAAQVRLFDRTLRARREELGLGQAQLAERVGVTQQTISRWENGEVVPPPKRLAKVAKALDLDLDRMLAYGGYLPSAGDWPRWHVLNLLYDQMNELSEEELLVLVQRGVEELRKRVVGSERKEPETAS